MKYLENYKIFETLNSRGSKSIDRSEFYSILEKNCKVWLNGIDNKLYRSQRNMGDYVYTDARGTYRGSIEDINLHIDIMDNLDCWKNYPKYSEGIIGISENKHVEYGTDTSKSIVYEVIPFDNIKIAVCPENNIWSSFSRTGKSFGEYIYRFREFLMEVGLCDEWIQEDGTTLEEAIKSIGNIGEYFKEKGIEPYDSEMFLDHVKDILVRRENLDKGISMYELTGENIFECVEGYMFNPIERRFRLYDYNEDFNVEPDRQIWCNGPVLLVDSKIVDEIKKIKKLIK